VAAFGPGVLSPDGTLDRAQVASIVFADDAKRRLLNATLHPRIGALTAHRAQALEADGHRLACYEAALLVENGLADAFRPLVVVCVSEDVQLARAMARDRASEEATRARLRAQVALATKIAAADYVIDNSGTIAQTIDQADRVLSAIRASVG